MQQQVHISCPYCGYSAQVPGHFLGQSLNCPTCRQVFLAQGHPAAAQYGPAQPPPPPQYGVPRYGPPSAPPGQYGQGPVAPPQYGQPQYAPNPQPARPTAALLPTMNTPKLSDTVVKLIVAGVFVGTLGIVFLVMRAAMSG